MPSPWDTLLAHCDGAKKVTIVAPYIKADTLTRLLNLVSPAVELECFTRWTPQDIFTGSSDTSCRRIIVQRGGSFQLHNRLHAKYYRFDEKVLVGSANATGSGLNFPQSGNLEILCEPGRSFDSIAFERELRNESRQVSDEEFQLWLECPVAESSIVPLEYQPSGPTIDSWKPLTRYPEYLWLRHTHQDEHIPIIEQRELARADLSILQVPVGLNESAFNNWIKACLLSAPFVSSVKLLGLAVPNEAWASLSSQWGLNMRDAARAFSTVENWIAYFESDSTAT